MNASRECASELRALARCFWSPILIDRITELASVVEAMGLAEPRELFRWSFDHARWERTSEDGRSAVMALMLLRMMVARAHGRVAPSASELESAARSGPGACWATFKAWRSGNTSQPGSSDAR